MRRRRPDVMTSHGEGGRGRGLAGGCCFNFLFEYYINGGGGGGLTLKSSWMSCSVQIGH